MIPCTERVKRLSRHTSEPTLKATLGYASSLVFYAQSAIMVISGRKENEAKAITNEKWSTVLEVIYWKTSLTNKGVKAGA